MRQRGNGFFNVSILGGVKIEQNRNVILLLKFSADQRSLFMDTPAEQQQGIEQLAERLQARLGPRKVWVGTIG